MFVCVSVCVCVSVWCLYVCVVCVCLCLCGVCVFVCLCAWCSGEEVMEQVCVVFTELSRDLRGLRDLPLSVTSLQATSPTFRSTEVRVHATSPLPW